MTEKENANLYILISDFLNNQFIYIKLFQDENPFQFVVKNSLVL